MINSRLIIDLDPEAQVVCKRHIDLCRDEGIELILTSTYRDYEEQAALFAQGRTAPGRIVTHAQPGQSFHNFKAAWDAVPLIDGKADWTIDDPPFLRMIALGKQAGARAGADWPEPLTDSDHFEYRPSGMTTMIAAKEAFDSTGTIFGGTAV